MKFVVLGRYTEQGLGGFVKNPSDNRQEAAKKITKAAGANLIEMMTLRGAYDFIAIIEGPNFETAAGMKMLMEATGTIKDMTIMESVDFNKAAEIYYLERAFINNYYSNLLDDFGFNKKSSRIIRKARFFTYIFRKTLLEELYQALRGWCLF